MKKSNPALAVYFLILIVFTAVVETLIIKGGDNPGFLYLLLMWIPAMAALPANIIKIRHSGEPRTLKSYLKTAGFRAAPIKYILLGCLLPLIYLLIPYMIYWKMNPLNFAYSGQRLGLILKDITPAMIIGIFVGLLSAAGEEIGWRGFMVPELYQTLGLNKTLLLSSFIWCCWHLPLLIFGDYMAEAALWYRVPAFILCIMPVGIITGLLALRTRSFWPAAFLHAAHNNYDQAVFDIITRGEDKMYYVSETGVFTVICAWILAAVVYVFTANKIKTAETENINKKAPAETGAENKAV